MALDGKDRLSADATVEANRLLGLALTRLNPNDQKIDQVISRLRGYGTKTAKRVSLFIEGFRARRNGKYDLAIEKFEDAAKLGKENYHIRRELAAVLCNLERFAEAEPHARAAYARSPDNPYIVDVLLRVLDGKKASGMAVDNSEIIALDQDLLRLCQSGKFLFHAIRRANQLSASNKKVEAVTSLNKVNDDKDPSLLFAKGQLYVTSNDYKSARSIIQKLYGISNDDLEARIYADRLDVECLIAETRFGEARTSIEARFEGSLSIKKRLTASLLRALSFDSSAASPEDLEWARRQK